MRSVDRIAEEYVERAAALDPALATCGIAGTGIFLRVAAAMPPRIQAHPIHP